MDDVGRQLPGPMIDLKDILPQGVTFPEEKSEKCVRNTEVADASMLVTDRLRSLAAPVPGAAEALGHGFGSRLAREFLDGFTHLYENGEFSTARLAEAVRSLQKTVDILFPDAFGRELQESMGEIWTMLRVIGEVLHRDEGRMLATATSSFVGAWLAVLFLTALFRKDTSPTDLNAAEYEVPKEYSPEALDRYFANRQFFVWTRCLSVFSAFGGFYLGIQLDRATGKLKVTTISARHITQSIVL